MKIAMRTRTRTRTRTDTHTHIRTHTHTRTHTRTRAHTHTQTSHAHTRPRARRLACVTSHARCPEVGLGLLVLTLGVFVGNSTVQALLCTGYIFRSHKMTRRREGSPQYAVRTDARPTEALRDRNGERGTRARTAPRGCPPENLHLARRETRQPQHRGLYLDPKWPSYSPGLRPRRRARPKATPPPARRRLRQRCPEVGLGLLDGTRDRGKARGDVFGVLDFWAG